MSPLPLDISKLRHFRAEIETNVFVLRKTITILRANCLSEISTGSRNQVLFPRTRRTYKIRNFRKPTYYQYSAYLTDIPIYRYINRKMCVYIYIENIRSKFYPSTKQGVRIYDDR